METAEHKTEVMDFSAIRTDGDTQIRKTSEEQIALYADLMRSGDQFPAVTVFFDGEHHWLADGFHRFAASQRARLAGIRATIRNGSLEEARVFACGANTTCGLPMTPEDRREAVRRLSENPVSASWTDSAVARHLHCSHQTVGRIRAELNLVPKEKTFVRKKRDGKVGVIKLPTEEKKPKEVVEEPPGDELEQTINELADTISGLEEENKKLKDAIAVGQWDASDIEKLDAQETIKELRDQIKVLEIDNAALRDSRDMYQQRNAELMATVKSLQAKLKKLEG